MSKYIEPKQATFDGAEQAALDMLSTRCPSVLLKTGAAVRELVVRPLAYLVAWATDNLERLRTETSAAYLKTSQATDNAVADAVASNYFIERRAGTVSRGTVALTLEASYLRLPRGARFVADGATLQTETVVVAAAGESPGIRDGVRYVPTISISDGRYIASIPVAAVDSGPVEIGVGTEAIPQFGLSYLVSAAVSSAITGGAGTETDAQLMARAEAATTNGGIGSYFGIEKKLAAGPVTVLSFGLVAGEDALLVRARYNNVSINPGGIVDCYVKTQNQLASATVTAAVRQVTGDRNCIADLPVVDGDINCHGIVSIDGPLLDGDTGDPITEYDVSYGSASSRMDAVGARLGTEQRASVLFSATPAPTSVKVQVSFMPGLLDLQRYMSSDECRFVGQDVMVKAAVPVSVSIDCAISYAEEPTDDQVDAVRQAMADYVNGLRVGVGRINFSDMREYCATALSGAVLRLPCTMSASMPLIGGGIDSFYSNTGILDITTPANSDRWSPAICYFSTSVGQIRITPA